MVAGVVLVVAAIVAGAALAIGQPWDRPADNSFRSPSPSASAPANVFPAEFDGTWTGAYRQSDGRTYTMELAITASASTAQVRYLDVDCRGTLTVLGRDGDAVRTQESILSGSCTPTGKMTLRLRSTNQMAADYTPDIAKYTASALLTKRN